MRILASRAWLRIVWQPTGYSGRSPARQPIKCCQDRPGRQLVADETAAEREPAAPRVVLQCGRSSRVSHLAEPDPLRSFEAGTATG